MLSRLNEFAGLNVLPEIVRDLSINYDYILMDTAPGLSKYSLIPPRISDHALFVVSPEPASGSDSSRLKQAIQLLAPKLMMSAVLNKFKKGKGKTTAADVQSRLGIETLVEIPEDDKVEESIKKRVPLVMYKPKSKASKAILELAGRLIMGGKVLLEEAEGKKEKGFQIKKVLKEK